MDATISHELFSEKTNHVHTIHTTESSSLPTEKVPYFFGMYFSNMTLTRKFYQVASFSADSMLGVESFVSIDVEGHPWSHHVGGYSMPHVWVLVLTSVNGWYSNKSNVAGLVHRLYITYKFTYIYRVFTGFSPICWREFWMVSIKSSGDIRGTL